MPRQRVTALDPRGVESRAGSVWVHALAATPPSVAADSDLAARIHVDGNAPPAPQQGRRFHGLDALRACALLVGIVQHSLLGFVMPPDQWAIGTTTPSPTLRWVAYYSHTFRLEIFFLLAGFFAALVIGKRGTKAFLKDRAVRILLVFVVLLYPMRAFTDWIWIAGGIETGWRPLTPELAGKPTWSLILRSWESEVWPNINITHLWFLYYLMWTVLLFIAVRAVFLRLKPADTVVRALDSTFRSVFASWPAPFIVALATTSLVARMQGLSGVDSPDHSLLLHRPVLVLHAFFFCIGWWLHRNVGVLDVLATRWTVFLPLGIVTSLVTLVALDMHGNDPGLLFRLERSFGTSLVMSLGVLGWIGLFVRVFDRPSPRMRYLADASYFLYIAHWPIVVGLQVVLYRWSAAPWWKVLLVNAIALPALLGLYHVAIRHSWVGAWLNGRRVTRSERSESGSPPTGAELPSTASLSVQLHAKLRRPRQI